MIIGQHEPVSRRPAEIAMIVPSVLRGTTSAAFSTRRRRDQCEQHTAVPAKPFTIRVYQEELELKLNSQSQQTHKQHDEERSYHIHHLSPHLRSLQLPDAFVTGT